MHQNAAGTGAGPDDDAAPMFHLHSTVQRIEQAAAPAAAGRSAVDDAVDLAAVVDARRLRRRLRVFSRVLRVLFVFAFFGGCSGLLFIPCVLRFPCRSQQSEAKGNLKALYVAEEDFRTEADRYTVDPVGDTGFTVRGAKIRYAYAVTDVGADHFRAWAFRKDGERADVWSIDERGVVENVVAGCPR